MVVGIVSDTHGDRRAMDALLALPAAEAVEVWLHAGDLAPDAEYMGRMTDKTVYSVAGNCDWPNAQAKDEEVLYLDGHTIFLAHGHTLGVRHTTELLREAARDVEADIAIYGHTHVVEVREAEDAILVVNPGSLARPRDAAEGSFALMTLHAGEKPQVEIIRMARPKIVKPELPEIM